MLYPFTPVFKKLGAEKDYLSIRELILRLAKPMLSCEPVVAMLKLSEENLYNLR